MNDLSYINSIYNNSINSDDDERIPLNERSRFEEFALESERNYNKSATEFKLFMEVAHLNCNSNKDKNILQW